MERILAPFRKPQMWASAVSGATERMYGFRIIDAPGMYWVGYTYKYKMIRALARSIKYSQDAVVATMFSFTVRCGVDSDWDWVCQLARSNPDTLYLVLVKERRVLDQLKVS